MDKDRRTIIEDYFRDNEKIEFQVEENSLGPVLTLWGKTDQTDEDGKPKYVNLGKVFRQTQDCEFDINPSSFANWNKSKRYLEEYYRNLSSDYTLLKISPDGRLSIVNKLSLSYDGSFEYYKNDNKFFVENYGYKEVYQIPHRKLQYKDNTMTMISSSRKSFPGDNWEKFNQLATVIGGDKENLIYGDAIICMRGEKFNQFIGVDSIQDMNKIIETITDYEKNHHIEFIQESCKDLAFSNNGKTDIYRYEVEEERTGEDDFGRKITYTPYDIVTLAENIPTKIFNACKNVRNNPEFDEYSVEDAIDMMKVLTDPGSLTFADYKEGDKFKKREIAEIHYSKTSEDGKTVKDEMIASMYGRNIYSIQITNDMKWYSRFSQFQNDWNTMGEELMEKDLHNEGIHLIGFTKIPDHVRKYESVLPQNLPSAKKIITMSVEESTNEIEMQH